MKITRLYTGEDGKSHFRPLEDNVKISWLHTRLFFGMLLLIENKKVKKVKINIHNNIDPS